MACVKQIPDWEGTPPRFQTESWLLDRHGDQVLDPVDAAGIELALRLVEQAGAGEVSLLSMGPERSVAALRRGLALGAARATLIHDPALSGADALTTARVLAAALRRMEFDVLITGCESGDGSMGTVPASLAQILDLPALTAASEVTLESGSILAHRRLEAGEEVLAARAPVLISVTLATARPRRPHLSRVLAAARLPLDRVDLAALGLAAPPSPRFGARLVSVESPPAREREARIHEDDAESGRLIRARLDLWLKR